MSFVFGGNFARDVSSVSRLRDKREGLRDVGCLVHSAWFLRDVDERLRLKE